MRISWLMIAGYGLLMAAFDAACGASYDEMWRPQVHYSPPAMWMNDPNGLIQIDGQYHLYFQHHPASKVWGPMHWGHAISNDLMHWTTMPIALAPDSHGAIFSGSAVLDRQHSSGLSVQENQPIVAIFTYHDHEAEAANRIEIESQGAAYSVDKGRTFQKLPSPVLANPGKRDFRDPQVQWNAASHQWLMTIVATDHVEFYTSADLKKWNYESEFGREQGDHSGVWECPNLIRMTGVDDGEAHDVLMVSVGPKGPSARGGVQYFTGRFDGQRFRMDPGSHAQWLEYGTDYYAAVTWNRDTTPPESPPVLLGWMNNWLYATKVPTDPWRGAMALPRNLKLAGRTPTLRLEASPLQALTELRDPGRHQDRIDAGQWASFPTSTSPMSGAYDISFQLTMEGDGEALLALENGVGQSVGIEIDPLRAKMTVRRHTSGHVDFDARFSDPLEAALPLGRSEHDVRIIIDRSSMEIFFDNGAATLTAQVFPDESFDRLRWVGGADVHLHDLAIYPLRSIWSSQSGHEAENP